MSIKKEHIAWRLPEWWRISDCCWCWCYLCYTWTLPWGAQQYWRFFACVFLLSTFDIFHHSFIHSAAGVASRFDKSRFSFLLCYQKLRINAVIVYQLYSKWEIDWIQKQNTFHWSVSNTCCHVNMFFFNFKHINQIACVVVTLHRWMVVFFYFIHFDRFNWKSMANLKSWSRATSQRVR